jgi:hypothetical protein
MYNEKKVNKHDFILMPFSLSNDGSNRISINFESNSALLIIRFDMNSFAKPSQARNFTS